MSGLIRKIRLSHNGPMNGLTLLIPVRREDNCITTLIKFKDAAFILFKSLGMDQLALMVQNINTLVNDSGSPFNYPIGEDYWLCC